MLNTKNLNGKVSSNYYLKLYSILEMFASYKRVVSSKVYSGSVFGRVCDILAIKGYMVFLPKYLENHFGIPQYEVHMYMGKNLFEVTIIGHYHF